MKFLWDNLLKISVEANCKIARNCFCFSADPKPLPVRAIFFIYDRGGQQLGGVGSRKPDINVSLFRVPPYAYGSNVLFVIFAVTFCYLNGLDCIHYMESGVGNLPVRIGSCPSLKWLAKRRGRTPNQKNEKNQSYFSHFTPFRFARSLMASSITAVFDTPIISDSFDNRSWATLLNRKLVDFFISERTAVCGTCQQ